MQANLFDLTTFKPVGPFSHYQVNEQKRQSRWWDYGVNCDLTRKPKKEKYQEGQSHLQ